MRRRLPITSLFFSGLFLFHLASFPPFAARAEAATTWYVDDNPFADFNTIQGAIDAASDGDTIIVRDGTYTGDGNRDIDFLGKAVHLMSENGPENSAIDIGGTDLDLHNGFYFHSQEDENSIVDGFSILNAYADPDTMWQHDFGSGITCISSSSPSIINNIIANNKRTGINIKAGAPTITNNTISSNTSEGIFCGFSGSDTLTITNNAMVNNGAAITIHRSSGTIANNVLSGNLYAIRTNEFSGTIENNIITENADGILGYGAMAIIDNTIADNANRGINVGSCSGDFVTIADNIISGNRGGIGLGAIDAITITNNIIARNSATGEYGYGGAIYIGSSATAVTITNNSIVDNTAAVSGGGIVCQSSNVSITNNILWGNNGNLEGCTAAYSCVENGAAGTGNIDTDPLFADPDNDDYHLKSEYGRWDPHANGGAGGWVYDTVTSPCIDAGDPASEYSNEPMPNFGRINMGAYGNTDAASKSGWSIPGDATNDCKVDILDMLFVRNLLDEDVTSEGNWKADVTGDGQINILDMLVVRDNLNMTCAE